VRHRRCLQRTKGNHRRSRNCTYNDWTLSCVAPRRSAATEGFFSFDVQVTRLWLFQIHVPQVKVSSGCASAALVGCGRRLLAEQAPQLSFNHHSSSAYRRGAALSRVQWTCTKQPIALPAGDGSPGSPLTGPFSRLDDSSRGGRQRPFAKRNDWRSATRSRAHAATEGLVDRDGRYGRLQIGPFCQGCRRR
jgi:hypothetical protein